MSKSKRVPVYLSDEQLQALDKARKSSGEECRSNFIRRSLMNLLDDYALKEKVSSAYLSN